MNCNKCGYDLPATAKFCRSCGTRQNQIDAELSNIQPATAPPQVSIAAPNVIPSSPIASTTISQSASSESKSKASIYAVIGVLIVAIAGGVGYWGWTQKKAADEQATILAAKQTEELKRKADEEQQQKIKEAEEKGRKEAEEKAKQEAQQAAASAVQAQSAPQATQVVSVLERASKCDNFNNCFLSMLEAVSPRTAEAIAVAATRISELNKFQRGDRKTARDLNKRGLDEFRNKNLSSAIELLTKAVAADPADIEIRSNLGFVSMQANNVEDAGKALANALIIEPRRTSTWIPIAEVFAVKGNSDAAVRALLLGYEFSANKEKSMAFYEDKSNTAERAEMKPVFASALLKIKAGLMN